MPDITMCDNENCASKNSCYRHMAKPSKWQSWSTFGNEDQEGYCDVAIPLEEIVEDNKEEEVK